MAFRRVGSDEAGMQMALNEARRALDEGEVPVGAVVVWEGQIIGRGHNQGEQLQDATAHAEMIALGAAMNSRESWRLQDCTLYVTLEPCTMCAGAILLSRIPRLVFGAADIKAGACGSVLDVLKEPRLNHRVDVVPSVLSEDCGALLVTFFEQLRKKQQE
jgi:tRNA(adenine34) deaminase